MATRISYIHWLKWHFVSVVPDIAGAASNLTEDKINEEAFRLIFAFDEVITTGGYREQTTLQQIQTNMEMESYEEKLVNMIKTTQMETAREKAKQAARSIRERQQDSIQLGSDFSSSSSFGSQSSRTTLFQFHVFFDCELMAIICNFYCRCLSW